MSIVHIPLWKIALIGVNVGILAFVALDPTVQVAIIAGSALVVANLPTLVVTLLTRKEQKQMSINVDGNLRQLLNEKATQAAKLEHQSEKLSHAEGYREGRESERDRHEGSEP